MTRTCPECEVDLTSFNDIAVHGGSVSGAGSSSLFISGTFPCPECDARLNYEAKFVSGSPT